MVTSFGAFLALAVVVIVTPGQDTALTIRNTLLGGRRGGLATAAGVSIGQATWAAATSVGLAAVVAASEPAFLALKLAGAAYLVLLGTRTLVDAVRSRGRAGAPSPPGRPPRPQRALRQGFLSNLGNPKMAIFFPSLLPQFAADPSFATLLLLGLIFCVLTLAWLSAYAVAVARARRVLERGRIRRLLDGFTGAALVAVGVRLAAERR